MKAIWQNGRRQWRAASAGFVAALFLLFGGTAAAQTGIVSTKHNLGSTGTGNHVSETAEVCVFCHTPHGGSTTAPAPLWNKRLGAGGTPAGGGSYTTYASLQTPSLDGTVAPVGSISLACLSCHDGTQAMDNIINAPGSGGFNATGGDVTGLGYTWTSATPGAVDAQGRLIAGVAALGTDLSNDHPIGIQYCGGRIGDPLTGTCKDEDFRTVDSATINGNNVFWVDTGGPGTKQRTDLPLYVRADNAALGPLVECGSCHDPHVSTGQAGPTSSGGRVAGETFLRISNASSAVCTACHVK